MARSDAAVLIDPLNYDPVVHGPPYLPVSGDIRPMKTARLKVAVKAMVERESASVGDEIEQLFQHFLSDYGGAAPAELAVLLAALRAEGMIHQAHHWGTKGPQSYGDHLLYDRVYSDVFGMVDGLGERAGRSTGGRLISGWGSRSAWAWGSSRACWAWAAGSSTCRR